MLIFAPAYLYVCRHIARLPLKSPPQTKRANWTWMEPNQYWRRLFRIMFGFVVNLKGVWSKPAPFLCDLCAGSNE